LANCTFNNREIASAAGKKNRGKKRKPTIARQYFSPQSLADLSNKVKSVWLELLDHQDIHYRTIAAKEISKYIFPVLRQVDATLTHRIEDILDDDDDDE